MTSIRECGFAHTKKPQLMAHVWDKLCVFIHYNVGHVVFIAAYIILKWQFDIRSWQILDKIGHHALHNFFNTSTSNVSLGLLCPQKIDRYVLCATLIKFQWLTLQVKWIEIQPQESKKEYFVANIFLFEKHLSNFKFM